MSLLLKTRLAILAILILGVVVFFVIPKISTTVYQGEIDLTILDATSNLPIENVEVKYVYSVISCSAGFIHGGGCSAVPSREIILFSNKDGYVKLPSIKETRKIGQDFQLLINTHEASYYRYYEPFNPHPDLLEYQQENSPRMSKVKQKSIIYLIPGQIDSPDLCVQIQDSILRRSCDGKVGKTFSEGITSRF